jgi:hypothetical protein
LELIRDSDFGTWNFLASNDRQFLPVGKVSTDSRDAAQIGLAGPGSDRGKFARGLIRQL